MSIAPSNFGKSQLRKEENLSKFEMQTLGDTIYTGRHDLDKARGDNTFALIIAVKF
jgi:hypothetical protein